MRQFDTGATRDDDSTKHDYDGYLSPLVEICFAEYMTKHRVQADGKIRASDNWKKGIPRDAYMKSLFRHFIDVWSLHHGLEVKDTKTGKPITLEDALCAMKFNVNGYLHELLEHDLSEAAVVEDRGVAANNILNQALNKAQGLQNAYPNYQAVLEDPPEPPAGNTLARLGKLFGVTITK